MSHHVCQAQNRHKCPIYKDLSHFFALNTFDAGIIINEFNNVPLGEAVEKIVKAGCLKCSPQDDIILMGIDV